MYLEVDMPIFGTVRIDGVKVKKVHSDGTFDAIGAAGWGGVKCSPDAHRLYNEDGTPAAVVVISSETDLLKAQVQALTARGEFLEDVIAELAMMVL